MGIKLLWTGIVLILALNTVIETFGGSGSAIVIMLGALLSVVGLVLYWFDK